MAEIDSPKQRGEAEKWLVRSAIGVVLSLLVYIYQSDRYTNQKTLESLGDISMAVVSQGVKIEMIIDRLDRIEARYATTD